MRARPTRDDDGVQPRDVDPEFEGVRRRQRAQLPRPERAFEGPSVFGKVAAAVCRDLGVEARGVRRRPVAGDLRDPLGSGARTDECERLRARRGKHAREFACLGVRSAPRPAGEVGSGVVPGFGIALGPSAILDSGMSPGSGVAPRLEARALRARDAFSFRALLAFDLAAPPQDQALRSARRSVALDGLDRTEGVPEETTRGFGGVSAGRREEGHGWTGPVVACEAQEAAHRRRHVRAENASVGMEFVHHHHRQAPPQPGPTLMGGEHGVLEEVWVRKDDVGVFAGPPLDGGFGVAVGRRDADPRIDLARESSQADQLVGGQGLRRREIENGRPVADVREAAPAPPPPA